jgi:O-antigen ligase
LAKQFQLKNALILAVALAGLGFMIFSWIDALRWYQAYRFAMPQGALIPSIGFRLNGGNTIAAFYSLIAFLLLGIGLERKSRLIKIIAGLGSLSTVFLILLSSSRGALLGVLAGSGFLLLLFYWNQIVVLSGLIKNNPKTRFIILLIFIVLPVTGILLVSWFFISAADHPTHGNALQSRNEFWSPAIDAFFFSPIIGTGPYSFYRWYMQDRSIPPGHIFLHAHNSYLDIVANMGLLGLAAFSWLIYRFIRLIKSQFSALRNNKSYFTIALLAGVLAFAVHSFFDGLYLMIFAGFTFIFVLVLLLAQFPSTPIQKHERILLAVMYIGVAGYGWFHYLQVRPITQAISAYNQNDLSTAQAEIKSALKINPNNTITNLYTALLYTDTDENIQTTAIPAMLRAVSSDPYWGLNHANLAALYAYNQQFDQALIEINKAVAIAPDSSLFLLNKGVIIENLGDFESAGILYEMVLENNPEWRTNYFWRENDFRKNITESFSIIEETQILSFEDAIHQSYGIPMVRTALVEIEKGTLEKAETLAKLAGLAYFGNLSERLELDWLEAKLAYEENNSEEVLALSEKILDQLESPGIYGPGSAGSSLYYDGVYRHPVLPMELVPQMAIIYLPGDWETRMYEISCWYAEAENPEKCDNTYQMLLLHVPDYEVHYQVSSPCGVQ